MPYWRLSAFYFFYFSILGALVPYWGLFLQGRGFDAVEIGQLLAILMATKIIAPNIWGWLGDHLGQRIAIVRAASLLSIFVFGAMFFSFSFWSIAIVMALYSFFWNASLPQFEVITFSYLKDKASRYARIRVWGSIGFIFTVTILGLFVDRFDTEIILPAVMFIFCSLWISSLCVADPKNKNDNKNEQGLIFVLKKPAIIAFFIAAFLMQFSHGPYYAFFSIHLEQIGYSKSSIGQLWALGVFAEVIMFIIMYKLLAIWGAQKVLAVSLFLAAIRWVLIGYLSNSLPTLLFAQLLHAATFGTFHAAAIHLVNQYFQGRFQGRGQALYSSLSFGAGGALGALGSGFLWDSLGPGETFAISSVIALFGGIIAWYFVTESSNT